MDDFGAFCYLDVQKTGSTFVTRVLTEISKLPAIASSKHATIEPFGRRHLFRALRGRSDWTEMRGGAYRDDCFYFNSVRHPFEYYASLYNYGCDNRGGLYKSLKRAGRSGLYDGTPDGFLRWVEHILDSGNAREVNKIYAKTCAAGVGFCKGHLGCRSHSCKGSRNTRTDAEPS